MPPPVRLTEKRLLLAAAEQHGNLTGMARALNCSRRAVYDAVAKFEPVQLELHQQREAMIDIAEAHVFRLVVKGEPWALRYILASGPGRRRGWGGGDQELEEKIAALEQALQLLTGSDDGIDYRSI